VQLPILAVLGVAVLGKVLPEGAVAVLLLAVCALPVIGFVVGKEVGKLRAALVQLRRYSPERGTVAIRFRRRAYAQQMLRAMNAPPELLEEPFT
jgi:hypothetical protein